MEDVDASADLDGVDPAICIAVVVGYDLKNVQSSQRLSIRVFSSALRFEESKPDFLSNDFGELQKGFAAITDKDDWLNVLRQSE